MCIDVVYEILSVRKDGGECGDCKTKYYVLRDEHGTYPVVCHDDCSTTVLNGKVLNILDVMKTLKGVEAFRLNFTIETFNEVTDIISKSVTLFLK